MTLDKADVKLSCVQFYTTLKSVAKKFVTYGIGGMTEVTS